MVSVKWSVNVKNKMHLEGENAALIVKMHRVLLLVCRRLWIDVFFLHFCLSNATIAFRLQGLIELRSEIKLSLLLVKVNNQAIKTVPSNPISVRQPM